jgi:hypothetical protein
MLVESEAIAIDIKSSGENNGLTQFAPELPPANGLSTRRTEMKRSAPTLVTLILTLVVSSTAFAGHIAGGRAAGNIAGGRTAGNIAGGRAAGNIPGGRSASFTNTSINTNTARLGLETTISSTFAGLLRMLLESGALL